jgi:hypothetical protein
MECDLWGMEFSAIFDGQNKVKDKNLREFCKILAADWSPSQ